MSRRHTIGLFVAIGALAWACSSETVTGPGPGQGMLAVKLTDAPTPLDSVKEVNVFVERIDARRAHTDSALTDQDLENEHEERHNHADSTQWVTIATPDSAFNLLNLQNGVTALLGSTPLDTGTFRGIRLIIDPARSNIVLLDGTVLTTTSTPSVEFENRRHHGLMVEMNDSVEVNEGTTTTLVLDLRLNSSLSLRGRTVRDGFFFRPVVTGRREGHGDGHQ